MSALALTLLLAAAPARAGDRRGPQLPSGPAQAGIAASPIAAVALPASAVPAVAAPGQPGAAEIAQSMAQAAADPRADAAGSLAAAFDGSALKKAQDAFYAVAGGSADSGDVSAARLTTEQRTAYFKSKPFKDWVASERAAGRRVFWLKDVDKTQAAGDVFTFFYKWRADNGKFTPAQNAIAQDYLKTLELKDPALRARRDALVASKDASAVANFVIELWRGKENGGEGIGMLDFWSHVFWPTQKGLSRAEKLAQVNAFAPRYAEKVYRGVAEENRALTAAGVDVVIVSNGDEELARAIAPVLGVKPSHVVGSNLIYDKKGVSTGVDHAYEIFDKEWQTKPQPGKPLNFHFWLTKHMHRWGWKSLDLGRVVIAGADGDSASTDGGMMILLPPGSVIANTMIDTPHEPGRLEKFKATASKYAWTRGRFATLVQDPHGPAAWDDAPVPPAR